MGLKHTWRKLLYLAIVALTGIGVLTVVRPALAATPVRIMPLGDSITGSPGCWRALLWQRLQSTGYTNIDFVGTLPDPGCGTSYDGNNEGHGGYLATGIVSNNQLPGWLSATHPDIVIMHLGTNDVWNHLSPSTITAAYTQLLSQLRASNPAIKLIIAKILPMNPSGCSDCYQGAINLDNAIPAWASAHSTAQSPITVVDQWSGFNTATDSIDGVHPNGSGNQKISDKWYPALTAALSTTTPTPTPTSPTGTTTLVNPASGRCLDITGGPSAPSGSAAQLWDCNGQTNQAWTFTTTGELRVQNNTLCLDAYNNQTANGTKLTTYTCNNGANQKFTWHTNGTITGNQSGRCLDITGAATTNGTPVTLYDCNGQTNQTWTRH